MSWPREDTFNTKWSQRVRSLARSSGDVDSARVEAHLKQVVQSKDEEIQAQTLLDLEAFLHTSPQIYADFVLEMLLREPPSTQLPLAARWKGKYLWKGDWSQELRREFENPGPGRGPFLALLYQQEEIGLGLIGRFLDAMIERWRRWQGDAEWQSFYERGRLPRIPLQTTLTLGGKSRFYWGDDSVFDWLNADNRGLEVAACALLSLKSWMEEQIKRERDVASLFEQVFQLSSCVAVLHVALDVARDRLKETANPLEPATAACMDAIVPLLCHPMLWRADWNIRQLMPVFVLAPHKSRDELIAAVRAFPHHIPWSYEGEEEEKEEEARELRQHMEDAALFVESDNYRVSSQDEGVVVEWIPPLAFRERAEVVLAPIKSRMRAASLPLWAKASWEAGRYAPSMTPDQALSLAQELHQPTDYRQSHQFDWNELNQRHEGVAAVAAVLLHLDEESRFEAAFGWCRSVILKAAASPALQDEDSEVIKLPHSARTWAARGLCDLMRRNPEDAEVIHALLGLAVLDDRFMAKELFASMSAIWQQHEVVGWNMVAVRLEMSLLPIRGKSTNVEEESPKERLTRDQLRQRSVENALPLALEERWPLLRRVQFNSETLFWEQGWREVLVELAPERMSPKSKTVFDSLFDDWMQWTLAANDPQSKSNPRFKHLYPPYQWNSSFGELCARYAYFASFDEAHERILQPFLESWPHSLRPLGSFLQAMTWVWQRPETPPNPVSVELWHRAGEFVLQSDRFKNKRDLLAYANDANTALYALLHCPTAPVSDHLQASFEAITSLWTRTLGESPDALRYFLSFLIETPARLWPQPCLGWLCNFSSFTLVESAKGNAKLVSQILLSQVPTLANSPTDQAQLLLLVDQLLSTGEPVAAHLLEKLTQAQRG